MEYKKAMPEEVKEVEFQPRLIIHGGAGNIATRDKMPPETYAAYRKSLLTIISKTDTYMRTPLPSPSKGQDGKGSSSGKYPSALAAATYAVTLLENDPLYNAGHGAVFTRDGINELEASVMVSRPSSHAKRGVGVTGLRRVRNPIQLARALLEHGDEDLVGGPPRSRAGQVRKGSGRGRGRGGGKEGAKAPSGSEDGGGDESEKADGDAGPDVDLDIPSAQGHTLLHGPAAESLARRYGLALVEPDYFFTRRRWEEHVRGLERERRRGGPASWSPDEFLPQGTCGAVALDATGLLCVATSTGGITNKLTGRIGDTPVVGAGFWAEEWEEEEEVLGTQERGYHHHHQQQQQKGLRAYLNGLFPAASTAGPQPGPLVELSAGLRTLLADCLPTPFLYAPVAFLSSTTSFSSSRAPTGTRTGTGTGTGTGRKKITTRATAVSGTGNGDSFLRTAAARTVAAIARFGGGGGGGGGVSAGEALTRVAGPGGELQRSAGARWGRTGEGEGGMIGIETAVERELASVGGRRAVVVSAVGRAAVLHDNNSAGMFRAWIDDDGAPRFKIWRDYDE